MPGNRRSRHYKHIEIEHKESAECPEKEEALPLAVAADTDRYSAEDAFFAHGSGRIGHIRNKKPPLNLFEPTDRSYKYGHKTISNAYLVDGACVHEEVHLRAVEKTGTDFVSKELASPDTIDLKPTEIHPEESYYLTEEEGADPRRSDR